MFLDSLGFLIELMIGVLGIPKGIPATSFARASIGMGIKKNSKTNSSVSIIRTLCAYVALFSPFHLPAEPFTLCTFIVLQKHPSAQTSLVRKEKEENYSVRKWAERGKRGEKGKRKQKLEFECRCHEMRDLLRA